MPDFTAMELQAREQVPAVSPRLVDHWLNVFSRALFSLVLAFGGLLLATALLMAGVIGSPVIAFVLATLALRRRNAPRAGAFATTG
jgi:hypothetical protein